MESKSHLDIDYVWYTDLEKSKKQLNQVSRSFCLAKWLQVTLHLHKGQTHSCHHPKPHAILMTDIKNNPAGLHNTAEKLKERQLMLQGQQPKPCEYCWNIENHSAAAMSDRIMKSSSKEFYPYANEVVASGLGEKINPKYLEVSFSHICNFKCSYCSADYSSKWQQEIEQYGSYSTYNGQMTTPTLDEDSNPYIASFWEWWPSLKKELHVFRITGGEPLLSKNTWKILDSLEADPAPSLELAVNSNLGVPRDLVEKFVEKVQSLLRQKKIARINVFTSVDGFGFAAEAMRHGFNTQTFLNNVHFLLDNIPQLEMFIMATYSALSVSSYKTLLEEVLKIRKKHIGSSRLKPLGISTSYLRYPEHLSVKILNSEAQQQMQETLNYMLENQLDEAHYPAGFTEYEINAMKNLIEWFQLPIEKSKKEYLQQQFKIFYKEHDERRGTTVSQWISENPLF